MKYRFAYDSYGRFIYEEQDDELSFFKIINFDYRGEVYTYSGTIDILDINYKSEVLSKENELLCNL